MAVYDALWPLEFRARPVPKHAELRRQIATDLRDLWRMNLIGDRRWLETLRAGSKLADDKEGLRRAEDLIVAGFPRTTLARSIVQERWRAENPYPDWNGPRERLEAYYAALKAATTEWARRWPADAWIRVQHFDAMTGLADPPAAEVEAAVDAMNKALTEDPGSLYSIPPTVIVLTNCSGAKPDEMALGMAGYYIPALVPSKGK